MVKACYPRCFIAGQPNATCLFSCIDHTHVPFLTSPTISKQAARQASAALRVRASLPLSLSQP